MFCLLSSATLATSTRICAAQWCPTGPTPPFTYLQSFSFYRFILEAGKEKRRERVRKGTDMWGGGSWREGKKEGSGRERMRRNAHLLVHSPSAHRDWHQAGAGRQQLNPGTGRRVTSYNHFNDHVVPPRVCTDKNLESTAAVGNQIQAHRSAMWALLTPKPNSSALFYLSVP